MLTKAFSWSPAFKQPKGPVAVLDMHSSIRTTRSYNALMASVTTTEHHGLEGNTAISTSGCEDICMCASERGMQCEIFMLEGYLDNTGQLFSYILSTCGQGIAVVPMTCIPKTGRQIDSRSVMGAKCTSSSKGEYCRVT